MAAERKVGISIILKDKMTDTLVKAREAASKLHKKALEVDEAFKKAAKGVAAFGVAATAAAAGAFLLTKKVATTGDLMIKQAQRLNVSTDAFQKLDHAMQISGTSMNAQRGALTRFTRSARDAANGVKVAEEAFERLGVSVKNQDDSFKQTDELLMEMSDRFSEMPGSVEKTALMMDLFGRSGAQLAQFLSVGSDGLQKLGDDAERLGGVMKEEAARKSESFIDALTRMNLAAEGVNRNLGERMQPMFTRVMEAVALAIVHMRKAFSPVLDDFTTFAKSGAELVVPVLVWIGKGFIGLGTVVIGAWKGIQIAINTGLGDILEDVNTAIKILNKIPGVNIEAFHNVFKDTAAEVQKELLDVVEVANAGITSLEKIGDAVVGVAVSMGRGEEAIEKARDKIQTLGDATTQLTDAELAAIAALKKSRALRKKTAEEAVERLKNEQEEYRLKMLIQMTNELAEAEEKREKAADERLKKAKKAAEDQVERMAAAGRAVGNAFMSGFEAAEEGQSRFLQGLKSTAHEAINMGLDVMEESVINYAKTAAAGAASSVAGVPVIGPALAAAAASAMFALVRGFIGMGFKGMAEGGFVTGGVPNRDSVPTMLMPGEYVMSKREVAESPRGGGPGAAPVFNIELSSSLPPSRAEMKKFVRQNIVPALRELRAQGMY